MSCSFLWAKAVLTALALVVPAPGQDPPGSPGSDPQSTGARPAGTQGGERSDAQRSDGEAPATDAPAADAPAVDASAVDASAVVALAVIVNPKNPTTGLSFADLRSYLKLEQQFWSNGQRARLYLRASDTAATKVLLDKVYQRTARELRKYWIGREFRGEIPAAPTVVPSAAAAGARVRKAEGAFAVVLASEVPDGVRVLAIDGKRPGDAGYPLAVAGEKAPPEAPPETSKTPTTSTP